MRHLVLMIGCLSFLLGCADSSQSTGLKVDVSSNPGYAKLLEPVKIIAEVTNGGVAVSKDVEVVFELIKKDGATIGSVTPDLVDEGKYQIETIFDEEGVYQIIFHVTLGEAHDMPVYEITISP